MKRTEMVETMMELDLTNVGTWMIEAIPRTMEELQEMVQANTDDDEENEKFYDAVWEAFARANSEVVNKKMRLLEVLKDHTIKNAIEILKDSSYWEENEDTTKEEFEEAVVRCQEGNGTDKDWDLLVNETQM